jgi:hypothetical protein
MVINIDAVRYGAGFDAAGQWHDAKDDYRSAEDEKSDELTAPARGAVCGLVLGAAFWVGIVAAVRELLTLFR